MAPNSLQQNVKTHIMKFGGGVLDDSESFSKIADQIKAERVVVVVSAMRGVTDQLIKMAKRVHPEPPKREMDMLVSVGERISISLLAMALALRGREAVSFTGSQSGIITTKEHGEAHIIDVRPTRIIEALDQGKIVIVAGFQGVSVQKEITTLGRGGSDTSAVALAIALRGTVEFIKDVPGIFLQYPSKEKHLENITHREALAIVEKTGSVLHPRAIALAEKNGLPLFVRGLEGGGTSIVTDKSPTEPTYEEPISTHCHAL